MQPLETGDPEWIGPYRLRARLGAGGMGQVFLGTSRDGTPVAIKVVHPGLAHDGRFRTRFRREIEVSSRVAGPWVAAVVDADPDAELPWLATQYVRGPDLGTVVEEVGPLPAGTVHALAHGLTLALGAVHDGGLVHRDLKPSNVLLDTDHPRLIDFGISRAVDGTRVTSTGVVIGTPAFMSPEQIAGEDVGPASDVFSLGSVLFFAATGRSPFGDVAPVVLMLRITRDEPDLDGLPDALRDPIAVCLAKRPQDRPDPATLGRMLGPLAGSPGGWLPPAVAALAAAPEQGAPTLLDEPPTEEVAGRRGTNRRTVLVTAAAAVTAAVAGAWGVSALTAPQPAPAPPAPHVRWRIPFSGAVGVQTAWAADDRTLYTTGMNRDVRALDATTGAERWSADGPADTLVPHGGVLITAAAGMLAGFDAGTGRRIWDMGRRPSPDSQVDVSDGTVVAVVEEGEPSDVLGRPINVVGLDAATGARLWTGERYEFSGGLRVVAGGGVAAYCQDGRLVVRELRTGSIRWSAPAPTAAVVAATEDLVLLGALTALESATGRQRWQVGWPARSVIAAGGVLLEEEGRDGESRVVRGLDPRSGTALWTTPPSRVDTAPVITEDCVYMALRDGSTCAYDTATGVLLWSRGGGTPIAAHGRVAYLAADGELLAVTGDG
ncbi:serine/threonine protein kinase [Pseudonocardia hierapolitana]|uniref:Serine/threonine protein kinase n=1 Tax=Pseudonocardia hierapolitana TaxID=1128676 RepID=A0A561SUF6_9PSEU|nr:serine/threonine protein kinase [Pseudonocardia hierapolitana]